MRHHKKCGRRGKLIWVLLFTLLGLYGCDMEPPSTPAYHAGMKVRLRVDHRPAIVLRDRCAGYYTVHYVSDRGEVSSLQAREFELEPLPAEQP